MMTQILTLKHIWQQLCPSDTTLTYFDDVIQCYQQPWRYYHTVQHLYLTDIFQQDRETQAKQNLAKQLLYSVV